MPMRHAHLFVLLSSTVLIGTGYAALAVWQHRHFLTHGHDLGLFAQGLWAMGRLRPPATTVRHTPLPNLFGDHFDPILLLLVPWYRAVDSPLPLVIAQALLFAAVIPLGYLLARQLTIPRWPAVILAIVLGIHPGFTTAVRFDFHPVAFAPALLITTILLAERALWRWYWVALAGFLTTKESMALYAALLGLTLILIPKRRWAVGVSTAVVSLGYFFVVTNLVMPLFADQHYPYWRLYSELGDSPGQMLGHVVRHPVASVELLFSTPEKRHTINLMFGSYAYLPVLSWTMWPMLFMSLAERFWSSSLNLWLFRFHFQIVMTTVMFVATLSVVRAMQDRFRRWPRMPLAVSIVVLLATIWTMSASDAWQGVRTTPPHAAVARWRTAVEQIPPAARVSAQDVFVPHLAHRSTIYQFPRVRDAEYIVLDPQTPTWPSTPDEVRFAQRHLEKTGWRIVWRQDTTTIFQRTPQAQIPPAPPGWE
jgi:uncharacterized membrane protein